MDATLRLKPHPPVQDEIENWDDDDDFVFDGDDLPFQPLLNSGTVSYSRRDSQSSFRSDFESVHGEEEKQVHLPGTDEKSTLDAIAAAAKAGIPLPKNVPPTALVGGTIKRLGGRKIKKIFQEDWMNDLEFPEPGQALRLKTQDSAQFPEVLRQVSSSTQPSPSKAPRDSLAAALREEDQESRSAVSSSLVDLEKFRDTEDDDFLGDGAATIKLPKRREMPKLHSLIAPPTPQQPVGEDDDFEKDLVLPEDGMLKLSARRELPRTPTVHTPLEEIDWAEGSLGTRFGGTRRDVQSNRSSSVSAFSPSIASSITAESEDEALDGLVLPDGPLDLEERLRRRRLSRSPVRVPEEPIKEEPSKGEPEKEKPDKERAPKEEGAEDKEDFLAGLEIGDGEIFDSRKLTLHRNIQVKETRPPSPARPKTSVILKFTNKPVPASRLPRPMGSMASHERSQTQSSLEPVSESGGPIPRPQPRRSLSRTGHSAHSSVTSLGSSISSPPTPSSTHTTTPSTPRRRELGQKTSPVSVRNEPASTGSQSLRYKRSPTATRATQTPARPATTRGYERPPSRTEQSSRSQPTSRPKTPVERIRSSEGGATLTRKPPVPFLPAGASASQSYNINAKGSRTFRRHDSETSIDFRPTSRAVSRSMIRSPSPRRYQRPTEKLTPEGGWSRLSMPRRVRNFGDGHELDAFDDLPTSSQAEAKYLKQPVSAKSQTRTRGYQSILPDRTVAQSATSPFSSRIDNVPSFARDTAASRIARETNLAQRNLSGTITPLTAQRIAQLSARSNANIPPSASTIKARKLKKSPQSKPHLISNLNPPKDPKSQCPLGSFAQWPVLTSQQWSRACGTTRRRSGGRATTTCWARSMYRAHHPPPRLCHST